MNTSTPDEDREEIERIVRRDLPGWKLSAPESGSKKRAVATHRVGDLDQLKKKLNTPRKTILVQSPDGKTVKAADVVNGVVTIVQG